MHTYPMYLSFSLSPLLLPLRSHRQHSCLCINHKSGKHKHFFIFIFIFVVPQIHVFMQFCQPGCIISDGEHTNPMPGRGDCLTMCPEQDHVQGGTKQHLVNGQVGTTASFLLSFSSHLRVVFEVYLFLRKFLLNMLTFVLLVFGHDFPSTSQYHMGLTDDPILALRFVRNS